MLKDTQLKVPQSTPNVKELAKKAQEIYDSHKAELEPFKVPPQVGKYIVVEVASGKFFIEDTKDEAMAEARKEFPVTLLFVRRIGELEKVSHHSSSFSTKTYAGIF